MPRIRMTAALIGVLCAYTLDAHALDLALAEITKLRVGACDTQVRFQVKLTEDATGPIKYRIGVYSSSRDKTLMTFAVPAHSVGETLHFAIPGSSLVCDNQIEIRLDDQNEVAESNRRNNVATVSIERPHSDSMIHPCAVPPEKCR